MLALRYLALCPHPSHRFFTVTTGWIFQILSETIDLRMKWQQKMKKEK
jgi:hypothetical protein